jgi:hypothetical protein
MLSRDKLGQAGMPILHSVVVRTSCHFMKPDVPVVRNSVELP